MSVRCQCVLILQKIFEDKVFFNTLKSEFKPQDTAFANFLILTALRRKTSIDNLLHTLLTKKIPNKQKILKYILLAASVEILYMDTPDYAAINEYVDIAKKQTDKFASGMVNAVLRKVVLKKDDMQNMCRFPATFANILHQDYTTAQIHKMEQMLLTEAPIDISVKENPKLWAQKLGGLLFENGTVRLLNAKTNISALEGYADGAWWVQDLAASLPVCFLKNIKGKKVLDLCAAPGGKTAQLLARGAVVTAVDVNAERLETLKENMQRLHFTKNLSVICANGEKYLKSNTEKFDLILLDAPCSATGTFRKHPEVVHFKTIEDIKKQLLLQQNLLHLCAENLSCGGILLYCTCSLSRLEDQKQIQIFLSEHPNFEIEPFDITNLHICAGKKIDESIIDKQVLRTLPYHMAKQGGADGFFACAIKRLK